MTDSKPPRKFALLHFGQKQSNLGSITPPDAIVVGIRLVSRDQYDIHLDVKVKMAQTSHREGRMKRWTRFRFLGGIFCSESGAATEHVLYQVA